LSVGINCAINRKNPAEAGPTEKVAQAPRSGPVMRMLLLSRLVEDAVGPLGAGGVSAVVDLAVGVGTAGAAELVVDPD
jgi:hypothetical protein